MTRVIIVLTIIACLLGLQFFSQKPISLNSVDSTNTLQTNKELVNKCLTKDGQILYGEVPVGIVCESVESISVSIYQTKKPSHQSKKPSNQPKKPNNKTNFRCEGKQHCSQVASCDEARFYLKNCPNTKMDGDADGIPCESQWCNS
jgi:hypothetical protein